MNFGDKVKYFNYRPIVSAWLFIMAGILLGAGIYFELLLFKILACVSVILLLITLIVKIFLAKKWKIYKVISIFIAFLLGFLLTFLSLSVYNNQVKVSGDYELLGKVCLDTKTSNSGLKVVHLNNVTIKKNDELGTIHLDGEVRLYLDQSNGQAEELEIGDVISGKFSLKNVEIVNGDDVNFYFINNNVNVIGFGTEEDFVLTSSNDSNIFDKIKIKTKNVLEKFMSEDYSSLGYTMIFGDKGNLNEDLLDIYSASGISHLLAVSGLHVGFIVTLFSLLLSLFKVSSKWKFYILSILTFLYAFLCGFSVSVTRAFIMTVILLFSKLRQQKYDSLSSVAFAGIILLICNPFFLFDVGFLLSFSAVISIILFSGAITDLLDKFLNRKVAVSLAVSLSVSIGTLPIVMICFNSFSIFSVFTNVLVIPLASVAYMLMLIFVLIQFIVPAMGVFIYMFEAIMKIVTGIGMLTPSISLMGCERSFVVLFGIVLVSSFLAVSDYFIIDRKKRQICFLCLALMSILCLILMFIC